MFSSYTFLVRIAMLGLATSLSTLCWCQQADSDWRVEVRRYAESGNWKGALALVQQELDRSPHDTDVLAWRARLLLWSGQLETAEIEWKHVLVAGPKDPDNWLGLAGVYEKRGVPTQALEALDRALRLDPSRADIHIARARVLLALRDPKQAQLEFRRAVELDPANSRAREALGSFRTAPKHRLLLGSGTDLFSFSGPYQQNDITLLSRWSEHWQTGFRGGSYERGGLNAAKFQASVTGTSLTFGGLTLGGTAARDRGIIPRNETFFAYDRGWRFARTPVVRGVEVIYGQHWYWYSSVRIMAITETTIVYLPSDWIWSLSLSGSRSQFGGSASSWSPSGSSKLVFPIIQSERHGLEGNIFFANGTETFSQIDQIGSTSSRTYGGGLRVRLTTHQDVTGSAAYQMRSQNQSQTSFGVAYGIRF